MDTPKYSSTITIGGTSQTTSSAIGTVLPPTLITRQSGEITLTAQDANGVAFSLAALNGKDVFAKPFNSAEVPVNMGTGVVSGGDDEIFTVSWVRDKMAAAWSTFEFDKEGTIVLYVEMEETGTADYFQWSTRFNVDDGDYTGDASILPLNSIIFYYNPTYGYDNSTVAADPGAGLFRLDDTTLANVTEMYVADDAESNLDLQTYWQSLGVGSHIYIGNPNVKNDAAYFTVSGAVTNGTGFSTVPLTFVDSGSSQFTSGSLFSFTIGVVSPAVTGPVSSVDDNLATFNGTSGQEIQDSGVNISVVNSAMQDLVDDTTPQLGGFLDAQDNRISSLLGLGAKTSTTLDIATGAVTQTQLIHNIGTESAAATDDFDSIVPATGQTEILITMNDASEVPTIKHATGTNTFLLPADTDIEMVMNTFYHFHHDGTNWKLVGSAASGGGGGNFPTSTDSGDKTTAYSVIAGDENTTVVAGSATTADFTITYDVSLWTTAGSLLTIANESSYIVKVLVSNTGTMTIGGGIDAFIGPNGTITMAADTATHVRVVART